MIEALHTTGLILEAETIAIEFFGIVPQLPLLAAFEEDEDQEEPYDPDEEPDEDDDLDDDELEDDDFDDEEEDDGDDDELNA